MTSETSLLSSPPESPPRVLLQARRLYKSYGTHKVLDGLNLAVREGTIYGFLGRNGAGKTTAIQIMMGIHKPSGGHLHFFGKKVQRPTIGQKKKIGYVSQEQFFYPWMNCLYLGRFVSRFYPDWDQDWFLHLLETFELPGKRKVVDLSVGMRVKLALALALAHRPKILILDEPTAGLDAAARREFLEIVSHQARTEGRTTFFSSHIVEEVERIADRVGILDKGRLRFQGRPQDLYQSVKKWTAMDGIDGSLSHEPLEAGFEILTENPKEASLIMRGEPALWDRWETLHGKGEALTLEDIFLALTTSRIYET